MKRNVYLNMKPLNEARELWLSCWDWTRLAGVEELPAADALDRVTAGPVFAALSSPSYHSAAMDGFAVLSDHTYGASEERPKRLAVGGEAFAVNTGHPLPPGCNAVVMIEQVHQPAPEAIEIRAAAFPWQHVRKVGEDIVAGELLFPHHHRLRAPDLAALLQAGVFRLEVLARPQVAVITTGRELIGWEEAEADPPGPGRIIDSNSVFLASLVREAGGVPLPQPRVSDDFAAIKKAVAAALEGPAQMVVINAGASAGSEDYTSAVLAELGEVLVHGITVMPGKPTILGRAAGKPVVGSPGYPVSAWVAADQFIAPALALMQGRAPAERERLKVTAARRLPSKAGQEEFLRVHLGRVGGKVVASPLKRGAGTITSLTRADAVLRIPAVSEGMDEGQTAEAELLSPRSAVEDTLVIVGSHDITLDLMADHMKRLDPRLRVTSSHLGSLAGLMAVAAGRCHLGGTHLLDPETGEYNVSYVKRHLAGVPVRLVTLALREQGFILAPGNPKGIKGLADLARGDVAMVNRQGGSGTRVLLDYHLQKAGMDPDAVRGYDNEEYTHMAVAVQVLAGGADVGLGILAAARALGLDFVPLATERYDLCIPQAVWDDHRVQALLDTMGDAFFRRAVLALGGYDVSPMGRIAWEG